MLTSATRLLWASDLLQEGHYLDGEPQRLAVLVRIRGEYGWSEVGAKWNPLDTTEAWPFATDFNSFGPDGLYHVRNYPTFAAGLMATLQTLRGNRYSELRDRLLGWDPRGTQHATVEEILDAWNRSGWGSINWPALLVDVKASFNKDATLLVAGSTGPSPSASPPAVGAEPAPPAPTPTEEEESMRFAKASNGAEFLVQGSRKMPVSNQQKDLVLRAQGPILDAKLSDVDLELLVEVPWGAL